MKWFWRKMTNYLSLFLGSLGTLHVMNIHFGFHRYASYSRRLLTLLKDRQCVQYSGTPLHLLPHLKTVHEQMPIYFDYFLLIYINKSLHSRKIIRLNKISHRLLRSRFVYQEETKESHQLRRSVHDKILLEYMYQPICKQFNKNQSDLSTQKN